MDISSKFLNLTTLNAMINADTESVSFDGVLLITSAGTIIGKFANDEDDPNSIGTMLTDNKVKAIDDNNEPLNLIGDGSIITLKDVIFKCNNNVNLRTNYLIVHCEDVIAFVPIKLNNFLKQLDNK